MTTSPPICWAILTLPTSQAGMAGGALGDNNGDLMFGNGGPRPRFAVGMRGYDRAQVDDYVAEGARWAAQAWGRIMELEARVAELAGAEAPEGVRKNVDQAIEGAQATVDHFVETVDAKAAELEDAVTKAAQPQLDELRGQVEVLDGQRRSALDELDQLRRTLHGLRAGLGVDDDQTGTGPDGNGQRWGDPQPAIVVPKMRDQ